MPQMPTHTPAQSQDGRKMMADAKFYMDYSRWSEENQRYETWEEAVERVMNMHREKYADVMTDELAALIYKAEQAYKQKRVLGAQRNLQFGGEQIFKHMGRSYNCSSSHIDRPRFFQEAMYLLLCGCGVGFSVQHHHVAQLPPIKKRYSKKSKVFVVPDSIEGWADSFGVLLSSYFEGGGEFPEYEGCHVLFDFSKIRPRGAYISGGFKAPGPDGLRRSLQRCEDLLEAALDGTDGPVQMAPIVAYDFTMHMSDAVLSGGIRRAATICLFSKDDEAMLNAKTGNWFEHNPQRGRSNNSVVLIRDELTRDKWSEIMKSVKDYGEPGFILATSKEHATNPCAEIGMLPKTTNGRSGFQMCVRADTRLITKDGIRSIGECADSQETIEIWNGKKWSAASPFKTGTDQEFWRVDFSDGSYLDVTENHKFAAKHRFQKEYDTYTTLELQEAIETGKYRMSIPRANVKYMEGGVRESMAYEYGFFLGDGSISQGRYVIGSVFEGSGKELINFKNTTMTGPYDSSPRSPYIRANGNLAPMARHWNMRFCGLDLAFASKLKQQEGLPEKLFSWDRDSILSFIAGWADADGSQGGNGIRIFGREQAMRDGQLLLTKCGIDASVNLMSRAGEHVGSIDCTRNHDVWCLQVVKTIDIPCQRLRCDNAGTAKYKGKNQVIRSIRKLDIIEDSYCLTEPEEHMCLFGNALTFQCNLSEINGGMATSREAFLDACEIGAILGTLQAGYTDFPYLGEATEEIVRREALLGVSITGWMNNPDVLFDPQNMRDGAEVVKQVNKHVAAMLGINPAARTTTTKPSGNASVILGTASGIHGEHSPRYFRNVQMNDQDEVTQMLMRENPAMIETSVWSAGGTDKVVSFPIVSPEGSAYKDQLLGVKQLEYVRIAQQNWVEYGTNVELCTDPTLRHNVSNTITVDDWDEVEQYIFDNRWDFAGISLLSSFGDKAYAQAPFTEVLTAPQIMERHGDAALFASGVVVDGLHAFNGNLWRACDTVMGMGETLDPENSRDLLKRDWVRRAQKFATNFFDGDIVEMTNCLKDCHNLHRWIAINRDIQQIDFASELQEQDYTEVDGMAGAACSGDQCEIVF